ncbi:MAG: hypothetical protein ABIP48_10990 [Planctomycetota bacterium]
MPAEDTKPLPDGGILSNNLASDEKIHVSFDFASSELRITGPLVAPPWLEEVVEKLNHVLKLRKGWDSYGAPPISPQLVHPVLMVLIKVMEQETPAPAIVPTASGGIQIEWHMSDIDLEVEILPTGQASWYGEDLRSNDSWEQEQGIDIQQLASIVRQLTRE